MSENKSCSSFLGVHIAERVLSYVFESVTRMPYGNKGYDFICKKEHKIEVKSSCLTKDKRFFYDFWYFSIKQNKIADYFLLLAFDNRTDLNPQHIWLIKGTELVGVIKKDILNKRLALTITSAQKSIKAFEVYELTDKLKNVITCCNKLKYEEDKK